MIRFAKAREITVYRKCGNSAFFSSHYTNWDIALLISIYMTLFKI